MNEFALLIDNIFIEIRRYEAQPPDILHKKVTWHPVVREYGVPFTGLENGNWVIRTIDPATLPPSGSPDHNEPPVPPRGEGADQDGAAQDVAWHRVGRRSALFRDRQASHD